MQPHERIALVRLLQCIKLAAGGIEDAAAYLRKWEGAFELYAEGAGGPFLQLPGLEGEARVDLRKLVPAGTAGNTSSLFENDAARAPMNPVQAALHLLTLQNFAPCGTIGTALWAGEPTARKTPDTCPAGPRARCAARQASRLLLVAPVAPAAAAMPCRPTAGSATQRGHSPRPAATPAAPLPCTTPYSTAAA